MENALIGIFTFFLMLLILILNYWYISIPVFLLAIWGYRKTENPRLRKGLRVFFIFIIFSVISGAILMLSGNY
jgi:hypothetical protein